MAFGPKLHGMVKSKGELDNIVVQSLSKSGLYDEVKDRLFEPGTSLSEDNNKDCVSLGRLQLTRKYF